MRWTPEEWDEYLEEARRDEWWDRVCSGCPMAGAEEWCAGCRKEEEGIEEDEEDEVDEDDCDDCGKR